MLSNLQLQLKRTLADNLGQCIKQTEAALDPRRDAWNECLGLLADFNRLERENLGNLVSRDDYNRDFAKLTQRALHLIDTLQEDDLSAARRLRDEIHERILVVTRPERQGYMEHFFSGNYFKNVAYIHYGDPLPQERFDLALLEDVQPEPLSAMLMEQYADSIDAYLIYFGEKFPLERARYADKVYYANSIFSLYARIREMLE
ncbi:MAG TPA: hypothetical protein PK228_16040, partial [Saprospiraceae bacterium]|nr:hypothetical protein [Saprospiraceae bacterium]